LARVLLLEREEMKVRKMVGGVDAGFGSSGTMDTILITSSASMPKCEASGASGCAWLNFRAPKHC